MNPNKNRLIMYLIMFPGFGIMGFGSCSEYALDRWVCWIIGIIMVIVAFIWGVKKIRCPYCNLLLNMKITYSMICPRCQARLDNIK